GNVQRLIILVSPSQIGWLLGHFNCAEMMSIGIPDPDSLRSSDKKMALLVNLNPVGHALVSSAVLVAKNAAVLQAAVTCNIVHANVLPLAVVVHVKAFAVWRECETVGLRQIFGQEPHIAA